MGSEFEPKIVSFFCNWCSYRGADLAGTSRIRYPSNTRIIRAMCSSRINELLILKAFVMGADGVLISGCHSEDFHYLKGNLNAGRRITELKPFLESMGINIDRLRLEWLSASEGAKVAETVTNFTQTIKELGPSQIKRRKD